jgi:hypothetical protein
MSNLSPFQFLGLTNRQKLGTVEVEAMFDYLPDAAFLIDLKQSTVILGNS